MYTETENTLRITIQPTNRCNLACSYCYQTNKGHKDLEFDKVRLLLDKVFEHDNEYFKGFLCDDYFNIILDFIGGEATLNMKLVNDTVSYFIKRCIETNKPLWLHSLGIWLETNGTTYFNDDVQAFIRKYHAKLDLPITIDGSKSLHDSCRKYHDGKGSYDDVAKAVKAYMKDYGEQPNTKLTISPANVRSMFDGLKNMIDLGYKGCRISCVDNEEWLDEDDEAFAEQLEKFYRYLEEIGVEFNLYPYSNRRAYKQGIRCASCGANGNAICLACDGKLFLCQAFSDICDMKGRPVLSIGDVEHGISEEGIKWLRALPERTAKIMSHSDECTNCPCNSICEYCPAVDYSMHGADVVPHLFKVNCNKHLTAWKLLNEHEDRVKAQCSNNIVMK